MNKLGFWFLSAVLSVTSAVDPCQVGFNIMDECGRRLSSNDLTEAVQFANYLQQLAPACVDTFQCVGIIAYTNGDLMPAIVAFEKAHMLNPAATSVLVNLGLARQQAGYLDGARRAYEGALALDNTMISAAISLCEVLDELDQSADALRIRRDLLTQLEALPMVSRELEYEPRLRRSLALALQSAGNGTEAAAVLAKGVDIDPRLHVLHALAYVPHVPMSWPEILRCRSATIAAVDNLIHKFISGSVRIPPGVEQFGDLGYYLTYNGLNDEEFRRKIGWIHALAYPELTQSFVPLQKLSLPSLAKDATRIPPLLPRRLKVGFVSGHVHMHSVTKMIVRLITSLPKMLFSVILFGFVGPEDYITHQLSSQVDKMIWLGLDKSQLSVQRNLDMISAEHLDVLVYPEIGMHLPTYFLAFRRLAPIQISTHGNSETSGLGDSIDYFVSFDSIEHPYGNAHYSEQLIRLEGFHSQFLHPMHLAQPGHKYSQAVVSSTGYIRTTSHSDVQDGHIQGSRKLVGLSCMDIVASAVPHCALPTPVPPSSDCINSVLYLCPQTLYKLHPWFDSVVADILMMDRCGTIMFLHGVSESWDVIVMKRITDVLALKLGLIAPNVSIFSSPLSLQCNIIVALVPYLSRIVIAPQRGHNAFLELLATADVIVDSYPFGGCTSSYEALSQGTPVVTTPSDALRGRFTLAMLRRLGLDQFIAHSIDDLAPTAVEVGKFVAGLNATERRAMQNDIATLVRNKCLGDDGPLHEWTRFMIRATAGHWRYFEDTF